MRNIFLTGPALAGISSAQTRRAAANTLDRAQNLSELDFQ
jgi:hypothetical protein